MEIIINVNGNEILRYKTDTEIDFKLKDKIKVLGTSYEIYGIYRNGNKSIEIELIQETKFSGY